MVPKPTRESASRNFIIPPWAAALVPLDQQDVGKQATEDQDKKQSSDDDGDNLNVEGKGADKARRAWKPLVHTMNTFSSYEIHRFLAADVATGAADRLGVVDESEWAGYVYYVNGLDKLAGREGIHHGSTRTMLNWSTDVDVAPLGDWLAAYTTGDVLTPLRAFLEHVHSTYIGADKEYVGYELRLFADRRCAADGCSLDWHVDECHIANVYGGEFDFEPLNVVTVLKGPGTLFMRDRAQAWTRIPDREYEAVAEKEQLQTGEFAIYRPTPVAFPWPESMHGAVHARPDNQEGERIVVQLMLGTKRQMKGVKIEHKEAEDLSNEVRMSGDVEDSEGTDDTDGPEVVGNADGADYTDDEDTEGSAMKTDE